MASCDRIDGGRIDVMNRPACTNRLAILFAVLGMITVEGALAANTADLDFTFTIGFLGADSGGAPGSGDESSNVEFEIPEGFQEMVFDAPRVGTTSHDITQTLGGIRIDDGDNYDALATLLNPAYDPNDPFANPPVYGAGAPPIVIDGSITAMATGPATASTLPTTYSGTDVTYLYGYYYGGEQAIDLRFDFDVLWTMTLANNDPGYTSSFINLSVRLLDDSENVLDEVMLTRCAVCGDEPPSLGNSQPGQTSIFTEAEPGIGGPLNNGTLSLFHPTIGDDGYFSLEIVTEYRASALIDPVPIPGAVWLFGSAGIALAGLRRRAR